MPTATEDRALKGTLLGQMVGDAIGLPWEGVPPHLIAQKTPEHALIFGRGMVSDDTEHAIMTILTFMETKGEREPVLAFERRLRKRMIGWVLAGPPSLGRTTLLATLRAAVGIRDCGLPSRGNGPLMRAPAIGAAQGDPTLRRALVVASTRLTHIDPIVDACAATAADAVAEAAKGARAAEWLAEYDPGHRVVHDRLRELARSVQRGESVRGYAALVLPNERKGVPGTSLLTLLMALKCWSAHPRRFEDAVEAAVKLGGDTDTVGGLTGALAGAALGPESIPQRWLARITDLYSPRVLERACNGENAIPNWGARALRNGAQFGIVVGHAVAVRPIRSVVLGR